MHYLQNEILLDSFRALPLTNDCIGTKHFGIRNSEGCIGRNDSWRKCCAERNDQWRIDRL